MSSGREAVVLRLSNCAQCGESLGDKPMRFSIKTEGPQRPEKRWLLCKPACVARFAERLAAIPAGGDYSVLDKPETN